MRYNLIMVSKYVTDSTYLFMKLILIRRQKDAQ